MISLLEKHPNKITPHIPIEKPKKQLPQRFPVKTPPENPQINPEKIYLKMSEEPVSVINKPFMLDYKSNLKGAT